MAEPGWHAVVTHMTEHIHTTVPVGAYVAQQTPGYGIDLLSTQKNTHILTAQTPLSTAKNVLSFMKSVAKSQHNLSREITVCSTTI